MRRVETPEAPEQGVVKGLDAQADAVDPSPAVGGERLHFGALGVALRGDLGIAADGEAGAHAVEDGPQLIGGKERRCPSSEKNGVEAHRWGPRRLAQEVDLATQ